VQFETYALDGFYDEYFQAPGQPHPELMPLVQALQQLPTETVVQANRQVESVLLELGATFTLGNETQVLPLDLFPRVITASDWQRLAVGVKQRVMALNLFCADVYGEQKILRDRKIPQEVVLSSPRFLPACVGLKPPAGVWCHVSGIDLVRDHTGDWLVLEDNLRVPSGIAYVCKIRETLQRVLPQLLSQFAIKSVEGYIPQLASTLEQLALNSGEIPAIAVLSPGPIEPAFFEHTYLAQQLDVPLVTPPDLVITEGYLHRHTAQGLARIDILYRRCNTNLIEGLKLGPSYPSGLAAITELCHQGRLALANTLGTGVADDKVLYAYVPEMIRYYLGEEPQLPNVPSYLCWRDSDRAYVLTNLEQLVVKSASEEGGRDMLIGPHASAAERATFADKIQANPRGYMAQPTVALSRVPTLVGDTVEGRHVDLRPYVLHQGDEIYVHPGGLTRVALTKGSLVVNSAQGGGSKDTWVLTGAPGNLL
jgi:uncharacterized circularly permuted ATP-grasp superfamily protein